jgi:hypothetical protein
MKKTTLAAVMAGLALSCSGGGDVRSTETATATAVSQPLSTAAPGYISAYAGSGRLGWAFPGDALLAADLNAPSGLALCPDGALYVSDTGNNRVVKFGDGHMTVVAGAQLPSGLPYLNLIKNPRAELPIVAVGKIPNWTVVSPAGGWSEIPWIATRPEPLDGEQYFRANPGATGEMYQEVNISPYLDAIIAGVQQFNFTGFVRSLSGDVNPDAARVIVEYRTSSGSVISSYDSGDQANRGEWLFLSDT